MRIFVPAVFLAACGVLTASAAPAVGMGETTDVALGSETITLNLGHNGINVGDSKTLYHDVNKALEELCSENYCLDRPASFSVSVVESTSRPPYQRRRVKATISLTVLMADWGGRAGVRKVLSNTIAAAFERGTFDPKNCYMNRIKGDKIEHFRDCMTTDYAEVLLSNGYNMNVLFEGPHSTVKALNYDCKREVDDMDSFLKNDLPWKLKGADVNCMPK
ncbi:hypothetical protein J4E81_000742 [Alternaria sp. BMP 2799]|nr:hypothetical protein J4E81_000742 [Alternaria sp. BMP 2799]